MSEEIEFEISNPSDKCFIKHKNPEISLLAIILLGDGKYGGISETIRMPPFVFGGRDEWWVDKFGRDAQSALDEQDKAELAKAFESFRYSSERTSMNNIGKAAEWWAKHFREEANKPVESTQEPTSE